MTSEGQAEARAGQTLDATVIWTLSLRLQRTNSEWVIPMCLAWVIRLILGCIKKMWNRGGKGLRLGCIITGLGSPEGSLFAFLVLKLRVLAGVNVAAT